MDDSTNNRIVGIVVRSKSGDQQTFEELYELTLNRVYFLALKMVRDHENAMVDSAQVYSFRHRRLPAADLLD